MSKKQKWLIVIISILVLLLLVFFVDVFVIPRVVLRREIDNLGPSIKEEEERFNWRFYDLVQPYYSARWELTEDQWKALRQKLIDEQWGVHKDNGVESYRIVKVKYPLKDQCFCYEDLSVTESDGVFVVDISIIVTSHYVKIRQR